MLRNGAAARSITRCLSKPLTCSSRGSIAKASSGLQIHTITRVASRRFPSTLALALHKPATTALLRYATTTPFDRVDQETEDKIMNTRLEAHPKEVSSGSSVRHVIHEEGSQEVEKDTDMLAGVRADLQTIKETFALNDVPREALYIGMAGVLPYLATSLSTVFLAWDINHDALTGNGIIMSGPTAEIILHALEPIQIGYGAVIISFLGAIHWGLEWAKYGGAQGYSRYAIGVIAPAIAWPTMLMPIEYGLIAQFIAFNYLYFADTKATSKGWCPAWYGTYRFVLTFVVGASIVVSLIGRGQISDKISKPPGPADRLKALRALQVQSLEREESEMRAKIVAQDEEDEE